MQIRCPPDANLTVDLVRCLCSERNLTRFSSFLMNLMVSTTNPRTSQLQRQKTSFFRQYFCYLERDRHVHSHSFVTYFQRKSAYFCFLFLVSTFSSCFCLRTLFFHIQVSYFLLEATIIRHSKRLFNNQRGK